MTDWTKETIDTNITSTGLTVDNIKIDSNTISSTNTNGDINLSPNGSGDVTINAPLFSVFGSTFFTGEAVVMDSLTVGGDLKVNGNDIKGSGGSVALTLSGSDVTVADNLTVTGKLEIASAADDALNLSGITVTDGAPSGSSKSIPIKCNGTEYYIQLRTTAPGAP